jgi:hypothetical protein
VDNFPGSSTHVAMEDGADIAPCSPKTRDLPEKARGTADRPATCAYRLGFLHGLAWAARTAVYSLVIPQAEEGRK